ncbi:Hsp20/alpha crystallin family protein [Ectobacillus antri]|jgi:spore coat protein M|uniref:Hsp20/alpha crystallin family protein n=1 Tax=Ectobacillus antri TaxID=2486280 RepID=A0ABT6H0J5_9BACI|nr:Hsp20/alpha crystallin family protein [Ectobacillus antri]MDG4656023.1 Hsp20/alpha crystallin family protein [Ectobacillus antri]MDG5752698.1 Hsp20/alpha crystallin family protein [Ectobacillus antri]
MCSKKKKDCFLRIEGFEQWMNQFLSDPFALHYPDGISVDLFETELEYIIEADLPTSCRKQVCIEKTENGLCILMKNNDCTLKRDIALPINIMHKKMVASFENGFLAIHISRNQSAQNEPIVQFED